MHSSIDHRIPLDQSLEGSEQLSNIYQNLSEFMRSQILG